MRLVDESSGKEADLLLIRITVEAIEGAIATGEAYVVETSNSQPTVGSNIHKVLLFPSLHGQRQDKRNSKQLVNQAKLLY